MVIYTENVKLTIRYAVMFFLLYLVKTTLTPEWLNSIKEVNSTVMSVIGGGLFATVSIVIKAHFESKVKKDEEQDY